MNSTAILIGLTIFGIAVPFIVKPFRQKHTKRTTQQKVNDQGEGRVAVLSALRDLDFDYKIGKVGEDDYVPARAQLLAQAAHYMEQLDEKESTLEEMIQKRRVSKDVNCSECGALLETNQFFCSKCGFQVNKVDCPSCGEKVRMGDMFCSSCGTQIQIKLEAVHS